MNVFWKNKKITLNMIHIPPPLLGFKSSYLGDMRYGYEKKKNQTSMRHEFGGFHTTPPNKP